MESDGRQSASGSVVTAARAGAAAPGHCNHCAARCPMPAVVVAADAGLSGQVGHGFARIFWLGMAELRSVAGGAHDDPQARCRRLALWQQIAQPGSGSGHREAGAAELLGNVMFIVSAPKTEVFVSAGQFASYGGVSSSPSWPVSCSSRAAC